MTQSIKLRRSVTAGSVPPAADFDAQTFIVNLADALLYWRDSGGTVQSTDLLFKALAKLASPAFTGTPTAPTAPLGTNTTQIATMAALAALRNDLVNGAGASLDQLNELAAALGNDPNFSTTVLNALANRLRTDAVANLSLAAQLMGRQNLGVRGAGITPLTAAYTAVAADAGKMFKVSGTWNFTLPAPAAVGNGYVLELLNRGSGTVTIKPNGSETINDGTSYGLAAGWGATLVCDGANWQVLPHIYTPASSAPTIAAYYIAGATGYRKWSDGFIEQWGQTSGVSDTFVVYPISFPNACRAFQANVQYQDSTIFSVTVDAPGQSSCGCHVRRWDGGSITANSLPINWHAVGY